MRWNVFSWCACGLVIAILAAEAKATTLVLDEVEIKAALPEFEHSTFIVPKSLTSNPWLPKTLSTSQRGQLVKFRERLEVELRKCLPGYSCGVRDDDLRSAQKWIELLKGMDDPRARLQVGLLRGWWLVATYMNDLKRPGTGKPSLNVQDATRYLAAQFTTTDDPLLQAGFLYAQAKVSLWANTIHQAIEALMFVERIEESTLTPELFAWLGALEEARGRLETAGKYYSRVRHGEYLAPSLVGFARISRHLGQCEETLRVGARFQTRVASREERERYLQTLLEEEAVCEALLVGPKMVEEIDGVNAPAVHKLAMKLIRERSQRSARTVVTEDLVACFNIQFPDYFRSQPLDLTLAGTAGDLELSQANDSGIYGSNIIGELEGCLQRRLAGGFSNWRIEGDVRIVPLR